MWLSGRLVPPLEYTTVHVVFGQIERGVATREATRRRSQGAQVECRHALPGRGKRQR